MRIDNSSRIHSKKSVLKYVGGSDCTNPRTMLSKNFIYYEDRRGGEAIACFLHI